MSTRRVAGQESPLLDEPHDVIKLVLSGEGLRITEDLALAKVSKGVLDPTQRLSLCHGNCRKDNHLRRSSIAGGSHFMMDSSLLTAVGGSV